jgi:hypothetical protein
LALAVSAFFRSAGRSWTTPPEIAFLLKASLANLTPSQLIEWSPVLPGAAVASGL